MGAWRRRSTLSKLQDLEPRRAGTRAGLRRLGGGSEGQAAGRRQPLKSARGRDECGGPVFETRRDHGCRRTTTRRRQVPRVRGSCAHHRRAEGTPGKSTLVNQLTGSKVVNQPQGADDQGAHPRHAVYRGQCADRARTRPAFKPKRTLDRAMVENAWGGAGDADAVVFLVDGRPGLTDEAKQIIAQPEHTEDQGLSRHQQDRPDVAALVASSKWRRSSTPPTPSSRPSW